MAEPCRECGERVDRHDRYCECCGTRLGSRQRDRVEVDVQVAAGISDRGLQHHRNEDALALRDLGRELGAASTGAVAAIVCDGVSCSARPDEASATAAEVAAEALVAALHAEQGPVVATREAIRAADRAVTELARCGAATDQAPACTLVSALVIGATVTVGWVGDSRAYWVPQPPSGAAPTRLTSDDSWRAQALAAGVLSPAQAAADRRAHAITAWLGEDADHADPHIVTIEAEEPGVVVVCTDGLWNYLDTVEELAAALPAQTWKFPLDAARRLVEIALCCGGRDNITVAVLPVAGRPPARPGGCCDR